MSTKGVDDVRTNASPKKKQSQSRERQYFAHTLFCLTLKGFAKGKIGKQDPSNSLRHYFMQT